MKILKKYILRSKILKITKTEKEKGDLKQFQVLKAEKERSSHQTDNCCYCLGRPRC